MLLRLSEKLLTLQIGRWTESGFFTNLFKVIILKKLSLTIFNMNIYIFA